MGVVEGGKVLAVYPDKCAGCMACTEICSLSKEGEIRPNTSRIQIVRREWQGLYLQIVCQQCDPPNCSSACPNEAISKDTKTGAMSIDAEKCTLCGACVEACPFGAIHVDKDAVIVCDLCGGEPRCVEWCPHQAIEYSRLETSEKKKIMDDILELKKATGYKPKADVK
ncbi:MAG: 4Fe-4S dicluster domain-containing protein [Methanobacteriota archaeon]